MSRTLWVGIALWLVVATACRSREAGPERGSGGSGAMAGMPGPGEAGLQGMPEMPGMEGMNPAAGGDTAGVPLDRAAAERLGITFARAAIRPLAEGIRVVGTLTYAEPRRVYVTARVMGWVEELYADYTGRPVRRGEPLLAIYAPELLSAQEEYLAARRLGDSSLAAAARRRLELWDVPQDQIERLDRTGRAERRLLLRAPTSGEIVEKMVTAGQAVGVGDDLFLIADRSVLWTELAVFEADARLLRPGMPVELAVEALPGRTYAGRVTFISPRVEEKTRTLTARVEVPNRDGRLRPGMYVTARLASAGAPRLAVPLAAVLPTGTRNLVFANRGDGRFVPREVSLGARNDSLVEIVQGLEPGDEVVASATYLLDSESNLAAALRSIMLQMGMGLDMGGMRMEGMEDMGDMEGMGGQPAGRSNRRPDRQEAPR